MCVSLSVSILPRAVPSPASASTEALEAAGDAEGSTLAYLGALDLQLKYRSMSSAVGGTDPRDGTPSGSSSVALPAVTGADSGADVGDGGEGASDRPYVMVHRDGCWCWTGQLVAPVPSH